MTAADPSTAAIVGATYIEAGWYVSTNHAAEELGVSTDAVLDGIERGRILARRVDFHYLIDAREVVRYAGTRQPGGGRTAADNAAVAAEYDGAQQWPAEPDWKGTAVVWRAPDGRALRISYHMAEVLDHLAGYVNARAEGLVRNDLWGAFGDKWSRTRVRHLISRLTETGLVMRLVIRDRHGGPVRHLMLTATGRDALTYCRERGLV
jgi:hypothetical protein